MGGRVDAELHFAAVDGQLQGVGESPGRNLLGESWPDRWTFERKRSYGLTMEVGGSPGALASMDATLYLLGGIRLEARHTPYCNEQWTALFPEVGVTVPTVLDAGETGLRMGMVWRGR